jgi:hypothetical protein
MGIIQHLIISLYFRWLVWRMAGPIDTLWIEINAELDAANDAIDDFVDDAEDKLKGLGDTADDTFEDMGDSVKKSTSLMGRLFEGLSGGIKKMMGDAATDTAVANAAFGLMTGGASALLGVVMQLATAIPNFFQNSAREAIAANKQFETFTSQFETLLGSKALANERLEELAVFGVETPFELPEIVEASRQLEVFGGAAIATGDNLRLIGDMAAGVNQPIQGVAFWIGRMYDAMQNGQPFGEASMRLQEMGILSGDVRREIEEMAKSGEDGTAVFERFAERVGSKFAGNMERLSKTLGGVQSNLADFQGNLLRVSGKELFEEFRQANVDFLATLSENEEGITAIGQNIGGIMADILRLGRELSSGFDIKVVIEQLKDFTEGARDFVRQVSPAIVELKRFGMVFAAFGVDVATAGEKVAEEQERMGFWEGILTTLSQAVALSTAGWAGLLATIKPVVVVLYNLANAMNSIMRLDWNGAAESAAAASEQWEDGLIDLDAGTKAWEESMRDSIASMEAMANATNDLDDASDDLKDDPITEEDIIEEPDAILDKIKSLSNQMIDAVEQRDKAQEANQKNHNERMAAIIKQGVEAWQAIHDNYNEAVAKTQAEAAEKEAQILASTQEQLAALRESTDKQLNDRRKGFQLKERRETEDHLRELRRLEDDYLFNLQDAVRARDARAIIDLQRNFNKAKDQKQESFDVSQGRDKEDYNRELADIRNGERERRDEILQSQAEQLADVRAHEQERLAELAIKRDEDLEQLRVNQEMKLEQERVSFAERQSALDEALQARLAAIAKSLSDQDDITEEGARSILETFNDYFGIGGDIDKMMDDFAKRRNQRMEIEVSYKETAPIAPRS